jgi:hypothetical protein
MESILVGLVVLLAAWNIFITYQVFAIKKQNAAFFDDGSKNLRSQMEAILREYRNIQTKNSKIELTLNEISKIIKSSYQKMSLVRYNPFSDTGGDLSFSLALLDLNDSGFVITGIHGRGVDRIYAKEVINGKSKHNLSEEEVTAIGKAQNEK